MTPPGNIAMLVNETLGVRVQGLKGRYTQILAHGVPQWPPLDGRTIIDGVRVRFGAR
ncbi:hypothetical protein [Sphingomonas melonis]|uniref:Uncharacterized protein n=1 Tax=Sphingomonas melonis TaxID=152682 RepID=A0A7Y9K2R2_9SPHN|nr:hypothetical protein [Sphingomonas melonis]NYD91187.1 hypothetical protein [Sphingomonas melonis]